MTKAQKIIGRIRSGSIRREAIENSDYTHIGSFDGYTSYYYDDGSRLWTAGETTCAAPAGALHEANYHAR